MANKITVRQGLEKDLPTLASAEPAYTTDTRKFFVGTGSGNVNMGGSQWYTGTALIGTSTSAQYYYNTCPDVKVNDIYMHTTSGNVYQCTTAGKGSTAKWMYKGCLKGVQGEIGPEGDYFPSGRYDSMGEVTLDLGDLMNEGLAPPTTTTIGCTGSQHQWLANYQCNGNNDTVMFQNAINSLPASGGKIVILEGNYNITSRLSVATGKKVCIEGMGKGTIINVSDTFLTSSTSYVTVRNMDINVAATINGTFVNSANTELYIDNCNLTVATKQGVSTSYIVALAYSGTVHMNNVCANITFNSASADCGAAFRSSTVYADLSKIIVTNNSSYNQNVFYYCTGIFANGKITGTQFVVSSGFSSGTDASMSISGCFISCMSPTQYQNSGNLTNNHVIITGNGGYCHFNVISGNQIKKEKTGTLIMSGRVVTGNIIENYSNGDISFWSYSSIIGNTSKYTMSSSTPTGAIMSGNVVLSSLKITETEW